MLIASAIDFDLDEAFARSVGAMSVVPNSSGEGARGKSSAADNQRDVWMSGYYPVYSGELKEGDVGGRMKRLQVDLWRQFTFDADQKVLAALDLCRYNDELRIARIIRLPFAGEIVEALDRADALASDLVESYEVRFLEFAGISVSVVWLACRGANAFEVSKDKFIPFSRNFQGLYRFACYSAGEFWERVESAAVKRTEVEDEMRRRRLPSQGDSYE